MLTPELVAEEDTEKAEFWRAKLFVDEAAAGLALPALGVVGPQRPLVAATFTAGD